MSNKVRLTRWLELLRGGERGNQAAPIITVPVQNKSGGALARGDIVVWDKTSNTTADLICVTTTTTSNNGDVLGMVHDLAIASDGFGRVQVWGPTSHLKVDGTVDIAIGDYIGTSTTAKIGKRVGRGFARALEAYATNDTSGVIDAFILNFDALRGSGTLEQVGIFSSSTVGFGIPLTSASSVGFGVFTDDGNAALTSGDLTRAGRFRNMQLYTGGNREQEAVGAIGQIVSVAGTNRHNMAGLMGSYEGSGALTIDGQAWSTDPWIQAGVIGRVGVGSGVATVNANGILAGLAAMSNTTSFLAQNGLYAGLYVGSWSGATDWEVGIYIQAGAVTKGIQVGELSSTTAGSGITLDATTTRAMEVHADDNNAARAVGTQGRAIFGRTMIYADNACEDWGIHGLSKISAVAKTGNVSAGVVGAFESTGVCSLSTGSGNCFVAGVMGRLGGAGTFTLNSGTYAVGVLAFNNTAVAFTNTGTCAFMATKSDIAGTVNWDYGLYIEDVAVGITLSATGDGAVITSTALDPVTGRVGKFYGTMAAPNMADGYGAFEVDFTLSGTMGATGFASASSSWVNIPTGTVGAGKRVCARNDGVYEASAATITNALVIFGARMHKLLDDTDALSFPFSLNTNNTAITALFDCQNITDFGTVANAGSSATTLVPFLRTPAGTLKYVLLYDLA